MERLSPIERGARVLVIAAASALMLAAAATVQSQSAQTDLAERLSGRWTLVSPERAQATIDRAIEQTTSSMLPIVSGLMARELRMRNPVNRTISIELGPDRIVTRYEHVTVDSAPGATTTIRAPGDQAETQVVQVVREGRLEHVFTTSRGQRWTLFTPSADGSRMTMESIIRSSLLPSDMRFQLEYQRGE